ncbi:MAG: NADH-quinone oxidoreductase subunit D [Candidatus Omnitrophota bacterium]
MHISEELKQRFPQYVAVVHHYRGDDTVILKREGLKEVARILKEDPVFDFCFLMDLSCVDYLKFEQIPSSEPTTATPSPLPFFMKPIKDPKGEVWQKTCKRPSRFELVYHFYSLSKNHRLRLKIPLEAADPRVDSLTDLWKGADWFEREVHDMFGIVFQGHPNLKRILMYEGFEGHPLRKDYPVDKRQPLELRGTREPVARKEGAETRSMLLNIGPSHPAMHGVIRILAELDGETVLGAKVEIGYLHRGFEKMCETVPYNSVIPYTDRLNYVSPLINNVGYCMAVEKLLGIGATERCQYIRVIMSEISRITDHLTCIGASAMELGAFTVFLYTIQAREYLWELIEKVTGARLTTSYTRVGGVKADFPEGFREDVKKAFKETRRVLKEVNQLLTRNRIFVDRMKGIGVISREDALSYGVTGPFLRSTGVGYDVRKMHPYLVYDRFDFDIPLGENGDNMDRYLVRMEEMEQSMQIVEQALEQIPEGALMVDGMGREIPAAFMVDRAKMGNTEGLKGKAVRMDPTLEGTSGAHHPAVYWPEKTVVLPPKESVYGNIEGLMNHFKLVMTGHGIRPPKGEVYQAVEGANGELGFFVVSNGSDRPYRLRVRPPCFPIMNALPEILAGDMMADVVPTFGSVNMIAGELDR